jgi:hypothetical protein
MITLVYRKYWDNCTYSGASFNVGSTSRRNMKIEPLYGFEHSIYSCAKCNVRFIAGPGQYWAYYNAYYKPDHENRSFNP